MAEYIDREVLMLKLAIIFGGCYSGEKATVHAIMDCPIVDVAPVVHGRWIPSKHRSSFFMCSVCESNDKECQPFYINVWKYCPSCGAKMDLEDGE